MPRQQSHDVSRVSQGDYRGADVKERPGNRPKLRRFTSLATTWSMALLASACVSDSPIDLNDNGTPLGIRNFPRQPYFYQTESRTRGDRDIDATALSSSAIQADSGSVSTIVFLTEGFRVDTARLFAELTSQSLDAGTAILNRPLSIEVELFVVPEADRAWRRVSFVRLPGQPYRVRFYLNERTVSTFPLEYSGFVAHEIYHLIVSDNSYAWSAGTRADEETAAYFFPACAQLDRFGIASWRLNPYGHFEADNGEREFGPLPDRILTQWLAAVEQNRSSSLNLPASLAGSMTLWMSISGGAWDIVDGTHEAERLRSICSDIVNQPDRVRHWLAELSRDGREPIRPESRPHVGVELDINGPVHSRRQDD